MKPVVITAGTAQRYYYEKDPIFNEDGSGNNIEFQGTTAEALGLEGFATKEQFKNILEGKDPDSGAQLVGDGGNEKKRAAIDLPFSAPKSVSHAALVLEDDRVVEAHDKAVEKALEFIEKNYAKTRAYEKDENGENQRVERYTGNIAVAKVKHSTARPVDGQAPDPSLHTHSLIMNITYDKESDSFKALSNEDIFKNQKLIQDVYKSELAKELQKSGFSIEHKSNGNFEIAGYDQNILNNFSKRHFEVEKEKEALRTQGFEGSEGLLDEVSQHNSKSGKVDMSKEELVGNWANQHEKEGLTGLDELREKIDREGSKESNFKYSAKEVMEIAAQNLHSNESVFSQEDLLKESLKVGRGHYGIEDFEKELEGIKKIGQKESSELVRVDEDKFTTKGMKDIESENTKIVKNQKSFGSLMSKEEARDAIKAFEEEKGWNMTVGQRNAVEQLLTNDSQFLAIQGDAGVGKTTLLEAFRIANEMKETNAGIQILAPTGKAASEAFEASGIDSATVDSFLIKNKDKKVEDTFNEIKDKNEKAIQSGSVFKSTYIPKDKEKDFKQANEDFKKRTYKSVSKNVTTGRNYYKVDKFEELKFGKQKGATRKSSFEVKGDIFKNVSETKLKDGTTIKQERTEWNPLKSSKIKGFDSVMSWSSYKNVEKEAGNRFKDFLKSDKKFGERFKDLLDSDKYVKSKDTGFSVSLAGITVSKSSHTKENGEGKSSWNVSAFGSKVLDISKDTAVKSFEGNKEGKDWKINVETKTSGFTLFGTGVKTKVETVKDKEGNVLSSRGVKEKSIFGIKFGKMTTMENGVVSETSYSKVGEKTLNVDTKLAGEYSTSKANEVAEQIKKDTVTSLNGDKILVVDESSMLSAKKANELLKYAEENNVRVVFMGDSKQLQSIESGRFFDQLKENTQTVEVTESVRQRGNKEAKEMVDKVASKDILGGLEDLEKWKGGSIVESNSFSERVQVAAAEIIKSEKDTLVVAGTRKEVGEVNDNVRAAKFGSKDFGDTYEVKVGKNLSSFAKQRADTFHEGQIVSSNVEIQGLKKYKEYEVVGKDTKHNTLTVKDENGKQVKIDLTENGRSLAVKEKETRNFAEGDRIVFLKNDKEKGVFNGELAYISKIDGNQFTVQKENGKEVQIDVSKYKDIDHGYAVTVNKSQGTTAKNVVAMFSTENGSMNNYNFSYVALSRHKENVTLVVDNYDKLKDQVINEQFKTSSLDFPANEGNKDYFDSGKKKQGEFKMESSSLDIRETVSQFNEQREGVVDMDKVKSQTNEFRKMRDHSDQSSKEFRESQRGFMDGQAVIRDGVSKEALEQFAKFAVDKNLMSVENAQQFVENSLKNAENLEKVGILEKVGDGEYKFKDEKAKEILAENLGKDYKVLAKENLEAYGDFRDLQTVQKDQYKEEKSVDQSKDKDFSEKSKDNSAEHDKS